MAVALDATGTLLSTTTAGSSINYTGITVGSGSNRGLVLVIGFDDNRITAPTAVWDSGGTNQSMTLLKLQAAASGTAGAVAVFGLANPIAGNKTLNVAWSTVVSQTSANAVSFTGVDQTGGVTSYPHAAGATGSTTTPTIAITSATGNMVVAGHSSAAAGTFTSTNNTNIFIDNALTNTSNAANRAAGAASVSMTATDTASGQWASAGTDILASGGAAAFIPYNPWPQAAPVLAQ